MEDVYSADIKKESNNASVRYFMDQARWEKPLLWFPALRFMRYKRNCEKWRGRCRPMYLLAYCRYYRMKIKYGLDIPAQTKIGGGFRIEHIGGIVINPGAVIGENCNIYNGVTIGAEKRGARKGNPVIGSCVWMGANCVIVGNIMIGDNVLIAPGAYVNFDVPSGSIVIGNPGKVIASAHATDDYIKFKTGAEL